MENKTNYYILFKTYTQGMAMQEQFRKEGLHSRISPAPRCIQGELGCGISLLLPENEIDHAREVIEEYKLSYHDIVALENQINPHRDKYC